MGRFYLGPATSPAMPQEAEEALAPNSTAKEVETIIKEVIVEREVIKEVEVLKHVEVIKEVQIPVETIREVLIPVEVIVEKEVVVEKEVIVEKIKEVTVPVFVDRIVPIRYIPKSFYYIFVAETALLCFLLLTKC